MIFGLFHEFEGDTTMAEGQSLTTREAVQEVLASEHADVRRESVALMVREIMELEVAQLAEGGAGRAGAGAPPGAAQWLSGAPVGYAGRGDRAADPQAADGQLSPVVLEPRRRAEQALVAVVQEAYVNGVSTRKVDRLVEQMGLRGLSKDQVSRMCRGLDEQVQAFRERPLEGAYPYLWLDAKIERVPEPGGVRQKALVIAYAVHESGIREVLGLDVARPRPRRSGPSSCSH
jgi:transposase-like protein